MLVVTLLPAPLATEMLLCLATAATRDTDERDTDERDKTAAGRRVSAAVAAVAAREVGIAIVGAMMCLIGG